MERFPILRANPRVLPLAAPHPSWADPRRWGELRENRAKYNKCLYKYGATTSVDDECYIRFDYRREIVRSGVSRAKRTYQFGPLYGRGFSGRASGRAEARADILRPPKLGAERKRTAIALQFDSGIRSPSSALFWATWGARSRTRANGGDDALLHADGMKGVMLRPTAHPIGEIPACLDCPCRRSSRSSTTALVGKGIRGMGFRKELATVPKIVLLLLLSANSRRRRSRRRKIRAPTAPTLRFRSRAMSL
jgi:hypothetical protein